MPTLRALHLLLSGLSFLSVQPPSLVAQTPTPDPLDRAWILERHVKDRWIHEGQIPEFVRFNEWTDRIHLRVRMSPGRIPTKTLHVAVAGVEADLHLDEKNHVAIKHIRHHSTSILTNSDRSHRRNQRWRSLKGEGATLNLPEARTWDIPFRVPAGPLPPNSTWTDTLHFMADPGDGFFQSMEGTRQGETSKDTVVDGRRFPLVRTLAEVEYTSEGPVRDWGVEGPLFIKRSARGTISSWAAVDTVLGVRAAGTDSIFLNGTATLITQNGREIPSPVRYEAVKTWALLDSITWARKQDSLSALRRENSTGMLILPRGPIAERLAKGDTVLGDSLMTAWAATRDPEEFARIRQLLWSWGSPSGFSREEVSSEHVRLRLALGDTSGVVHDLAGMGSGRLTAQGLTVLMPYLDDLKKLWRLGLVPDHIYWRLAEKVYTASPILEADSSRWDCESEACEMLVEMADAAQERRLKDLGLVAAFVRDPSSWHDSIRVRSAAGSLVANLAYQLSQGVPGGGNYSQESPIPGPEASWREWMTWLGGPGVMLGFGGRVLGPHHRHALHLYEAWSGRDPLGELQARWPPVGDSAGLVLGAILRETGRLPPSDLEDLEEVLLSGSGARFAAASAELIRRLGPGAPLAGEDVLKDLLSRFLEWEVGQGGPPWISLGDYKEGATEPPERTRPKDEEEWDTFVLDEDLPDWTAELLEGKATLISPEAWADRSKREGGRILGIGPVRAEGPFVGLSWRWTFFRKRRPDQPASGFASGGTAFLLRTDRGWVHVTGSGWIT